MGDELWNPPELDADTDLDEERLDQLEAVLKTTHGDDCESFRVFELTPTGDGAYEVLFLRKTSDPYLTEQFSCTARLAEDGWKITGGDRRAVTTVRERSGRLGPTALQDPLDLTSEEHDELETALEQDSAVKRPFVREGSHQGYYHVIYGLERLSENQYMVFYYTKYPQKPGWAKEKRCQATREGDEWTISDITLEERYNFL